MQSAINAAQNTSRCHTQEQHKPHRQLLLTALSNACLDWSRTKNLSAAALEFAQQQPHLGRNISCHFIVAVIILVVLCQTQQDNKVSGCSVQPLWVAIGAGRSNARQQHQAPHP